MSAVADCQRQAQSLAAVDVIPKPIDFDRMLGVVRRYCDSTDH
jgi:DNA-binding NtrC family response regulator